MRVVRSHDCCATQEISGFCYTSPYSDEAKKHLEQIVLTSNQQYVFHAVLPEEEGEMEWQSYTGSKRTTWFEVLHNLGFKTVTVFDNAVHRTSPLHFMMKFPHQRGGFKIHSDMKEYI